MKSQEILHKVQEHLQEVISRDSDRGIFLWEEFLKVHPADIAQFLTNVDIEQAQKIFIALPNSLKADVFEELSLRTKVGVLHALDEQGKVDALNQLPADELADVFELLSDDDLKRYLQLLHKKSREKVLALMQFPSDSAGGIMETDVLTLQEQFTVAQAISILQRLRPKREVYHQIYVTNRQHQLTGYVNLEDLVLNVPGRRIIDFMHKPELVAHASEDREAIAKQMVHYGELNVPVVNKDDHLLGVIPGSTLVDIIVEEASEDVQKMSALTPLKYPYFETSFSRLLFERGYILLALFLAQSFSTAIQKSYEGVLELGSLFLFTTMLISTGGNASSQTSAVVIQGMASGDITGSNIFRFIRRELLMAGMLSFMLGSAGFIRGYMTTHRVLESLIISITLALIVLVSVTVGSAVPILLKRLNIDPAFAAGPFLATLMDILGILIYCMVAQYMIQWFVSWWGCLI